MKHTFSKNWKFSAISVAMASTFAATQAAAQEDAQEQSAEDSVDRIIVTGSRIARDPNLSSPSPIQSISEEDIRASGEFTITDIVNDIPALFSSTTSESSIDSAFADGANILNLRGLGSNRTLVLVNGRRHVGGVQGSSAVDVGSIPAKLVKSVEVLTGGASAVYGADAVTGVVNFILKDDFEGFDFDVQTGISSEGDGQQLTLSALMGQNFDDGRGNFTIAIDYRTDDGLRVSDRDGGEFIGSGRDWLNPAKRFQQGQITSATPNFAQYYNYANTGLTDFGLPIPSAEAFIADYTATFGMAPNLTQAEIDMMTMAASAAERAVLPGRTFPFTSGYGYIIPGNPYTFAGFDPETPIDLDGNGRPDCLDSFTGYNSSFGAASFGVLGGCWNVTQDGTYRPVQDGLVASGFQGFGGDSFNTIQQQNGYIILPDDAITVNMTSGYDITEEDRLFAEVKYVTQSTENEAQPTSFWDLLFGAPDNPFLPSFIQDVADQTGGVAITIDPIGIGRAITTTDRETIRGVVGIEGYFENDWNYELSVNYGQFTRKSRQENSIINDRFMAAIDAVIDPATGQPACRVDVDPDAPAQGTPFNIPNYDPGYFSFTPGSGQCVPLNIWAGATGITDEAVDFVTTTTSTDLTLKQMVIAGSVAGDSSDYFELPAGAIAFAFGGEYREEKSEAVFDPWQRGIIPAGSILPEGSNIADASGNNSLTFRPALINRNEVGEYDVWDVFVEASIPVLDGVFLAEELTLDLAARFSDYSTVGNTTTWRANVLWTPVEDITFRGSISEAVRAPNITELFGPEIGTTFRPADPCDAAQIAAVAESDPGLASNIQNNCIADFATIGLNPVDGDGNYTFSDPLSAAFGGVTGGNADLQEETAETTTLGFVFTPTFLEGFSITVDYWDITIDDAISTVSSQNIVDGCYRGESLNTSFCDLFTRNGDSSSLQFGGFNFMKTTSINFAKLETSGIDFSISTLR